MNTRAAAWRWALIAAATGAGFWQTWVSVWKSAVDGGSIGYIVFIPILAALVGFGVAHRPRRGPLIQDRQTDVIVGLVVLVIALSVERMLVPRLTPYYFLLNLDVLAAWLFVVFAVILLFGLRPVTTYWQVVVFALVACPLVYRVLAVALGGGRFAYGFAMVIFSAAAVAFACGRGRGALILFGLCLGVGAVAIAIAIQPKPVTFVLQLVATIVTVAVGTAWWAVARTRRSGSIGAARPVSLPRALRAAILVPVACALFALIPLPAQATSEPAAGPPWTGDPGLVVPAGWVQLSVEPYDWAGHYFSSRDASLVRQTIRTREPDPQWDSLGRNRTAQIDVLTVSNPVALEVTPIRMSYDLSHGRISESVPVDVGRGITADMSTVVDDNLLLTWTNLSFEWARADKRIQRVTIVTVDNHEPDAYFPEPVPSPTGNVGEFLELMFRGVAAVSDTRSEFKDRDLVETLGRELVEVQKW
ncbi:DUF3488 domain-containing protein [Nocardia spumae]|uniref:DUF3488 domain-containing protein n=1 Tax=Nocardia spumae TaxID=2887190 RepID=UPI001D13B676|nr:DUF3488 domain-containing protein [Nocardia spumae]